MAKTPQQILTGAFGPKEIFLAIRNMSELERIEFKNEYLRLGGPSEFFVIALDMVEKEKANEKRRLTIAAGAVAGIVGFFYLRSR